jgi:hypothetical protein
LRAQFGKDLGELQVQLPICGKFLYWRGAEMQASLPRWRPDGRLHCAAHGGLIHGTCLYEHSSPA